MSSTIQARPAATPQTRPAVTTTGLSPARRNKIIRQILLQFFLLLMLATVLFPVMWIISMAVDPRGISRPTDLTLIPANATFEAFYDVLTSPLNNTTQIYFGEMLMNSLFIALGTALFTVSLGASAAYAFSRFKFIGQKSGLLVFILLQILPATGTIVALYAMFNSVQISSTLAQAAPAFFAGFIVCAIIFMVFRTIAGYLKPNPERAFNPSPRLVTGVVVVLALVAIIGAFAVMFQRNTTYAAVVDGPILEARAPRDAAREAFRQEEASFRNNDSRARSAEARATAAAQDLADYTVIVEQAATSSDLAAFVQAEINERQGIDDDNPVWVALVAARSALESGDQAAGLQALNDNVVLVEAEATDLAETAATRREGATEAEADLATAQQAFVDAQAALDAALARGSSIRTSVFLQLIPLFLVAWVGALLLAGVIWGILYALRSRIEEPRTVINVLLWALLAAILVGVGTQALQARMTPDMPPTQTLRTTLLGMMFALASGGLPFAIWNLKGYFDTIPKDLEQAALIDGAGRIETFFRIMLPLSLPAFAITILFSFMGSWTEYLLSWLFLTGQVHNYTLAMALASMAGGTNNPPPDMQQFAALAILVSLPILLLFFAAQRWIVSGLTIGAVK